MCFAHTHTRASVQPYVSASRAEQKGPKYKQRTEKYKWRAIYHQIDFACTPFFLFAAIVGGEWTSPIHSLGRWHAHSAKQ